MKNAIANTEILTYMRQGKYTLEKLRKVMETINYLEIKKIMLECFVIFILLNGCEYRTMSPEIRRKVKVTIFFLRNDTENPSDRASNKRGILQKMAKKEHLYTESGRDN